MEKKKRSRDDDIIYYYTRQRIQIKHGMFNTHFTQFYPREQLHENLYSTVPPPMISI